MLLKQRIPISYIFSLVKFKLLLVVLIAGGISYFDGFFEAWGVEFPIVPDWLPGVLGTLITLVLAFRMNQSYDRWWEARKVWGAIVNDSRSLIREVSFLRSKKSDSILHLKFKEQIIELLVLWLHSLKTRLRNGLEKEYYAKAAELGVHNSPNLPNAILHKMEMLISEAFSNDSINEYQQLQITKTLNNLNDGMGKCERIKGTVFPKLYSDTIDFTIWFFVIIFPLSFRDPNDYVEFPVVVILSMVFLILEKLAINLQDPFENTPTDVPLDTIVYNIEVFANEVLGKEKPEAIPDKTFYQV